MDEFRGCLGTAHVLAERFFISLPRAMHNLNLKSIYMALDHEYDLG